MTVVLIGGDEKVVKCGFYDQDEFFYPSDRIIESFNTTRTDGFRYLLPRLLDHLRIVYGKQKVKGMSLIIITSIIICIIVIIITIIKL